MSRDSDFPFIHYGVIASGNSLVKDAKTRDAIARSNEDCICLEMEAAGMVNSLPCLVIRGLCDYADSHKNDHWQRYSAACAAAFAKELLGCIPKASDFPVEEMLGKYNTLFKNRRTEDLQEDKEEEENLRIHNYRRTELAKRIARLLPRLYTTQYADRKNRNIKRVPQTCEWFINHPRFLHWNRKSSSSLLWVSADPGCGKSVLARYLVDEKLPASNRTLCYFFFKDDSIEERRSSTAICALLHQLLKQKPELHQHPAIENMLTNGDGFIHAFSELWNAFIAIVTDPEIVGETICVFDALDECVESDRDELMQALTDLDFSDDAKGHLKILLTSRPYDYMRRGFHELESRMPVIHLSGEGDNEMQQIHKEIGLVIEHRVRQIGEENKLTPMELEFLSTQLASVENRTYIWVHITIDIIRKASSFDRLTIKRAISEVPQSLDAAYEKILQECPDENKARLILGVILASQEPLFIDDISLILALRDDHKDYHDLKSDMEPIERMAQTIRDLCGLFVVINDEKVYLLHQTAREFLLKKTLDPRKVEQMAISSTSQQSTKIWKWRWSFNMQQCHQRLGEACVRFLHLAVSEEAKEEIFVQYASYYWMIHLKEAMLDVEDPLTALALNLCDRDFISLWLDNSPNAQPEKILDETLLDHLRDQHRKPGEEAVVTAEPKLIIAARTHVLPLVEAQLRQGANVNVLDAGGKTALAWAIQEGDLDIVHLLLKNGARTKGKDLYPGYQPLHTAVYNHRSDMVVPLLNGGAPISGAAAFGEQAIHSAARLGDIDMVKILLRHGADVNAEERDGVSVLQHASAMSSLEMVQFLVSGGAMLNHRDDMGRTALTFAILSAQESVVKFLLSHGAKVEEGDNSGDTALMCASGIGSTNIMKLLLDHGAQITAGSKPVKTPLHQASYKGHLAVMKLLLERGALIDAHDHFDRRAIHCAAMSGQTAAVQLLLDQGSHADILPGDAVAPLWDAARSGHNDIINLLMGYGTDVNAADEAGETALLMAAWYDHAGTVKLLLDLDAKADIRSIDGDYALTAAAEKGHSAVVRLLLERGAQVDCRTSDDRSPLDIACENSHKGVALMLIKHGADTKHQGSYGATCLHLLVDGGKPPSEAIAKAVIRAGCDMKVTDWSGRSPPLYACLRGLDSLVKLFLEEGLGVNEIIGSALQPLPSMKDAKSTQGDFYDHLQTYFWNTNPSSIWRGWTPLHAAAYAARADLVHHLLDNGADVNILDHAKRSSLYWAVMGSLDNFLVKTDKRPVEMPHFWTQMGIRKPPFINSEFKPAKEALLKELYPMGYSVAQLRTVALLIAHGANTKVKGVNWRYKVTPGLRRYAKERKAMLDLLKSTKEEAMAIASKLAESPTTAAAAVAESADDDDDKDEDEYQDRDENDDKQQHGDGDGDGDDSEESGGYESAQEFPPSSSSSLIP